MMLIRNYWRAWTKSYTRKDGTEVEGYWRKIYLTDKQEDKINGSS